MVEGVARCGESCRRLELFFPVSFEVVEKDERLERKNQKSETQQTLGVSRKERCAIDANQKPTPDMRKFNRSKKGVEVKLYVVGMFRCSRRRPR